MNVVIVGVSISGEVFRPSDWAERICGSLCTFEGHRIHYSPLLHPSLYEGHKCIMVDVKLKKMHPDLFEYIFDFAKTNQLKIVELV